MSGPAFMEGTRLELAGLKPALPVWPGQGGVLQVRAGTGQETEGCCWGQPGISCGLQPREGEV